MDIDFENLKLEAIDGERHVEREYTAYAQVADFGWTERAHEHELHEQWTLPYQDTPIRGRLRLINNRRYTEAVKQPLKGEEGHYECECDISPDMFEMKKLACKSGYLKDRYNFHVPETGLKWEIDVFRSKSGGRSNWIKIDLEYIKPNDPVPAFPFEIVEGTLIIEERVMSEHDRDFIDSLWDDEWLKLDPNSALPRGDK